jgi:hypothetical protein
MPGKFWTHAILGLQTLRHHPVPSMMKNALRPMVWALAQQFLVTCAPQS